MLGPDVALEDSPNFVEGAVQQKNIVPIVFDEQNITSLSLRDDRRQRKPISLEASAFRASSLNDGNRPENYRALRRARQGEYR